jgi:uncharacterized phage protein gp47/JayE
MAEIKTIQNRQVIDYMARDYDSFRQALIDRIPEKLPNWTDRSEADFGIVLIELFAYMADILSYYQDRVANESFLATAQERRSVIQHLRLIGYELAPASPASAKLALAFTVDNARTGLVKIQRGDQFSTPSTDERPSVTFEYADHTPIVIDLESLAPDSGGTGKKKFQSGQPLKDGETKAPKVPVVEGQLIEKELIGVSDGSPNQRHALARPRLIRDSQEIGVEDGGLVKPWQWRESLVYSRVVNEDYTLQTDENNVTTVIFGDGVYGKIPANGASIWATYRTGGGRVGNVPAGAIKTISKSSDLIPLSATVSNPEPATGGEEREAIDHAIRFAPLVFKSNRRAVTVEDFVALAKQFPGVGKARAHAAAWNQIDLYIAPAGGGYVTDILKSDLLRYFEDKRMMMTQLKIKDPAYVPIYIKAQVKALAYAFKAEVKAKTEAAVATLLNFDAVDFKETLHLSKIYEAIEHVPGVDSVFVSQFCASGPAAGASTQSPYQQSENMIENNGRLVLADHEIPVPGYPASILVTVEGGL